MFFVYVRMYVLSLYYLGWAILGLKLCIPNCILTLTAALMDFLDPISRFADATAAPVERRSAHVPRLRLPFAICTSLSSIISTNAPQNLTGVTLFHQIQVSASSVCMLGRKPFQLTALLLRLNRHDMMRLCHFGSKVKRFFILQLQIQSYQKCNPQMESSDVSCHDRLLTKVVNTNNVGKHMLMTADGAPTL